MFRALKRRFQTVAPSGPRGVINIPTSWGRSLMNGHGKIETLVQLELVALERRGELVRAWYDKRAVTGLVPGAHASSFISLLPAWIPVKEVKWLDAEPNEGSQAREPELAAEAASGPLSRPSSLAG